MYSNNTLAAAQDGVRSGVFLLASRILKPLVRIFIRYGFSCQEFTELTRWAFVQVAMNDPEFALPSRGRQFKSRAAVLTGLSRKEILRLMEYRDMPDPESVPTFNRAARVLNGWATDRRYIDPEGRPLALPLKGETLSFHSLVKEYSGDVPPRAVLDELRRCRAVETNTDGRIRIVRMQHYATPGSVEELEVAAMSAGDLLNTLDQNLKGSSAKRLQREVFSTLVPETSAERVAQRIQEKGDVFVREMQSYLASEEDRGGGRRVRIGVGLYRFGG